MRQTKWEKCRRAACLGLITSLLIILTLLAFLVPGIARAITLDRTTTALANCTPVGDITPQSLLIVLLDRSGSLVDEPGATDPDGYSTSVTKALADLWSGTIAVIPFSNESTPVIGPYAMSDSHLRQLLKDEVQAYQIGGDTPLDPAMQQALALLKHAPSGSRVIIVTDGSPEPPAINGVNQANDIRQNLLHQFCSLGIPVSAIGLALDLSQPDGQAANALLTEIANGTDEAYTNVRDAHELAQVVVQLFAQWQHLTFLPAQASGDSFTERIDTYARRVTFVAFRSSAASAITLDGPDGQRVPVQSLQQSTDRHYEIDNMTLSDINQPGTYTINVSDDPQAQVYALVESRLHAVLVQPSTRAIAYIGQPLQIQAELMNGPTPVVPKSNEATINAQVNTLVNGQVTATYTVELTQVSGSPLFTGKITLPGPVGQVHVRIEATYLLIPVDASNAQVTIPLQKPKPVVVVPQTPACGANVNCYLTRYRTALVGGLSALLLLVLLLFLLRRRKSKGWELMQGKQIVDLGTMGRPLGRKLFHKSAISSRELEEYGGLDFHGARFALIFKGNVKLVVTSDEPKVTVSQAGRTILVTRDSRQGIELADKDAIVVQGCKPAVLRLQQ